MAENNAVQTMEILREVRKISNLKDDAETKFEKIMGLIAAKMDMSVAAAYVVLDDTYLELIALKNSDFPENHYF